MQIIVKTLTGKSIPIEVEPTTTVHQLKLQIQAREYIPPDQQRLIFGGKQLPNDHTLAMCNIHEQNAHEGVELAVVHLVVCVV